MRVLVTGNQGYIGSSLVPILKSKGHEVVGLDTGYFKDCNLVSTESPDFQYNVDIRFVEKEHLVGVDAVIHLAGLSNDPLGELNPGLTEQINLYGTIRLAEIAKKSGVKRFVFSSSQSIYGVSDVSREMDEYNSEKAPVTAYAISKWHAERELLKMTDESFQTVYFRPSTVFGASPRLRSDIVFNNFLGCAFTTKKIEIRSDGTPWRPVVHVQDVISAFIAGIDAPSSLISGRAFNVGVENGNYTVRDIADAAGYILPDSEIVFTKEHGNDARTYRVSFSRIFDELGSYYQPKFNLHSGGNELVNFFKSCAFSHESFIGPKTNRLRQINYLLESGLLSESLTWV